MIWRICGRVKTSTEVLSASPSVYPASSVPWVLEVMECLRDYLATLPISFWLQRTRSVITLARSIAMGKQGATIRSWEPASVPAPCNRSAHSRLTKSKLEPMSIVPAFRRQSHPAVLTPCLQPASRSELAADQEVPTLLPQEQTVLGQRRDSVGWLTVTSGSSGTNNGTVMLRGGSQ